MSEEPEARDVKRGSGRPRSDIKRRKLTIALREDWIAALDRLADLREQSTGERSDRTTIIRQAIQQYLTDVASQQRLMQDIAQETPPEPGDLGLPDISDLVQFKRVDDSHWLVVHDGAELGVITLAVSTGRYTYKPTGSKTGRKPVSTLIHAQAQAQLDHIQRQQCQSRQTQPSSD